MRRSKSSLWWRDSNKPASGKTGAVQTNTAAITLVIRFAALIDQVAIVHLLGGDAKALGGQNVSFWLLSDILTGMLERLLIPRNQTSTWY